MGDCSAIVAAFARGATFAAVAASQEWSVVDLNTSADLRRRRGLRDLRGWSFAAGTVGHAGGGARDGAPNRRAVATVARAQHAIVMSSVATKRCPGVGAATPRTSRCVGRGLWISQAPRAGEVIARIAGVRSPARPRLHRGREAAGRSIGL